MKCKGLIDYFTFHYAYESDPDRVIEQVLGMDYALFESCDSSPLKAYRRSKRFGNIAVCYEGIEQCYKNEKGETQQVVVSSGLMGVCVSMSGQGCRTFESMSVFRLQPEGAFAHLMQLIHINPDINVTRVDLSLDDHAGVLNMSTIEDYARERSLDSRIQRIRCVWDVEGKEDRGKTLYVGASSSMFRIRIYDKAKEQYEPGEAGYNDPWIRVEMVMRGKQADGFVDTFCNSEDLGKLAAGILNNHLRFIERNDSNITRCATAQWWLDFLESVEKIKILLPEPMQHSLEEKKQWFMYQMAPTLAMLVDAYGPMVIKQITDFGSERMRPRHKALLEDFQKRRKVM